MAGYVPGREPEGASAMTAATGPSAPAYDDVVDLGRYPISDPAGSAYQSFVQACQDQLRDQGVAQRDPAHPDAAALLRPGSVDAEIRTSS
ncbi:MAG: hypothetical protein ACRDOB_13730 [Streptosporangiaceae bacterium]